MAAPEISHIIAENLAGVRQRMAAAAQRAGRQSDQITLIAVTKYVDSQVARILVEVGCADLGESRPQQLWQKTEELSDLAIRWHLIGHLQRNKVKRTLMCASLIHSADSRSLLRDLNRHGVELERRIPLLLEINISSDPSKHGFAPDDAEGVLAEFVESPGLEIRGLMAMAGLDHQGQAARHDFQRLRALAEHLRRNAPPHLPLDVLSMGMSGDFEQAIEEGATMVRVGSALFEGIPDA